jgi:hypothetical protein
MAETSKLLFPSVRFFIFDPLFSFLIQRSRKTLLQVGAPVARGLAPPVVGLLESAGGVNR